MNKNKDPKQVLMRSRNPMVVDQDDLRRLSLMKSFKINQSKTKINLFNLT
jgi:hypothetical protein